MSVGTQATAASINQALTSSALNLRNVCTQIQYLQTFIQTLGTAGLEGIGFSATDAASVVELSGYLNNITAVYYGTGTQQTASNFDQALSVLWGGQ